MRTRRAFKAHLAWDAAAGKVNFEFAPSKFPPRKTAGGAPDSGAGSARTTGTTATKVLKSAAKTTAKAATKPAAKKAKAASPGKQPSAALAAVIGAEPVAHTEVIKKVWDYVKAQGLQDASNKRAINADALLLPVFGKPQITMFELAGIVGKHLA